MSKATGRWLFGTLLGLLALGGVLFWSMSPPASAPPEGTEAPASSPSATVGEVRALLLQGVAYAEIGHWQDARASFERVIAEEPGQPTALFDLAVTDFQEGQPQKARERLAQLPDELLPELAARAHHLRARLAYEAGDIEEERRAYEEAMRLAPEEAVYPYALSELYKRLPDSADQRGVLLERAYQLWPDNARLGSDFAFWALSQAETELRQRGLSVLEELVAVSPKEKILAYLAKGRQELDDPEYAAKTPASLRAAFNTLLGTKPFQSAANALEDQLQMHPVVLYPVDRSQDRSSHPTIRFAATAAAFPAPELAAGERVVQAVAVDDATEEESASRLALLSDRGLYLLAAVAWQRLAELAPGSRQLLAGELNDDGKMELVVMTGEGVRVWQRGEDDSWQEPSVTLELADAGAFREALLIDFEHDGDLDLLAVDLAGQLMLFTHRGEAGWGPPRVAPLPAIAAVRCLTSADLDGDYDQDLILGTESELVVLRNWRQGELSLHERHPLASAPEQLVAFEFSGEDASTDLVVRTVSGIELWRADRSAHLEPEPRSDQALRRLGERLAPGHLGAGDLDMDGDLDLLVAARAPAGGEAQVLENRGDGTFELAQALQGTSEQSGFLLVDLDGDHAPELLTWAADKLEVLRNEGAADQHWLTIRLRAPNRKVPLDARGAKLQIAFGDRVQWLELQRPNVTVGLGQSRPTLVKATWPNGISEYLFDVEPNSVQTLTLSMRVEGSCPFLYAASDEGMRFITDILGLSPLGMLVAPGQYVQPDPEEYLLLPDWVRERDGTIELRITEELREVTYLDQVELVAVDAPEDVAIYNGERWLQSPVEGLALRLLSELEPPQSVRDHRGAEVLDIVREEDHRYLTNHARARRYQGAVAPHSLTLEVSPKLAAAEHPALVLIGWLHWGNTSTNVARSQDPDGAPIFPFLEVPGPDGGWVRVPTPVGLPAGKTKPVVVDLRGVLDPQDPRLRLTTDFEVYWDRIALARLDEAAPHRVHRLTAGSAELRFGGFSRWYRPAANGPYLFDYSDRRSYPWRTDGVGQELPLAWQEHEGFYTAFGPVETLLDRVDDGYVVFGSGDEVRLVFSTASLPQVAAGWHRRYFLHSEGWEKDGDPNVACSQTVEPLPFRGMTEDPCSGTEALAPLPDAGALRSRWVSRDRLVRRVEAWRGTHEP